MASNNNFDRNKPFHNAFIPSKTPVSGALATNNTAKVKHFF